MNTAVVSVMSRTPRDFETYYRPDIFLASLKRFGVEPTILGHREWWGGLMSKPRYVRQWLRSGACSADALIVSDAFDVIFTAHPNEVAAKWQISDVTMFNAERGLFPRSDLASAFRDPGTPWRYLNSGLMIGKPANILALLEAMGLDDIRDDYQAADELHGGAGRMIEPNDQGHFQYAFAAHPVPLCLDTQCDVFQSCSACTMDDFDLSGALVKNIVTGTFPLVWHFNGGSKNDLLPAMLHKWNLG